MLISPPPSFAPSIPAGIHHTSQGRTVAGGWGGGAGDLPTEEEVGAGPAADAAVMSEPATGGGQPRLLVPHVPAGGGPPWLPPLNPFPASLSQTAIPQLAWPTRFPDFTTGPGADSRTVSSGRETPGCLASSPGTSQPPRLPSSQTQRGRDLPPGLLTHRGMWTVPEFKGPFTGSWWPHAQPWPDAKLLVAWSHPQL